MIRNYINGKEQDITARVIKREDAEAVYQIMERIRRRGENEKKSDSQQSHKNNNSNSRNNCDFVHMLP